MREKLIKLIREAKDEYPAVPTINCCKAEFANFLADHLLASGVIVSPCKMGDTLYRVVTMGTGVQRRIIRHKHSGVIKTLQYETKKNFIRKIVVSKNNFLDVCENFGKTVFSTKEEAEQALKGGD